MAHLPVWKITVVSISGFVALKFGIIDKTVFSIVHEISKSLVLFGFSKVLSNSTHCYFRFIFRWRYCYLFYNKFRNQAVPDIKDIPFIKCLNLLGLFFLTLYQYNLYHHCRFIYNLLDYCLMSSSSFEKWP